MIQGLAPAYIAMNNQQLNIQQISTQPVVSQSQPQQAPSPQIKSQVNLPQGIINACIPQTVNPVVTSPGVAPVTSSIEQLPPPKRKPKKKKKKEPKLDLANIMKLSGIGDDDDIHFESDTSESALSCDNHVLKTPKSETPSAPSTPELETHLTFPKRIGNIHISAVTHDISKISQNTTQTNAILEKHFTQTSQISVQQSLSDINAINQNLTQIGILNQNTQNFLSNQVNIQTPNLLNQDTQSLQNFLHALHQNSFLNGQVPQNIIPVSSMPGLTTFSNSPTSSTYPKFAVTTTTFSTNMVQSIVSTPNENLLTIQKPNFTQAQTTRPTVSPAPILSTQTIQSLSNQGNIIPQNSQNATILTQNSQNATLLAQNSQNATLLAQNSQNNTILSSQNATILAQNSQNATILTQNQQNATLLAQNTQNATLLAQNSQNATLLAQNSQNNTILSSQNATILAQNSQNATILAQNTQIMSQNSQNSTILNSQNAIIAQNNQTGGLLAQNSQNLSQAQSLQNTILSQNQQSGTILTQNSQNGTILTQNSQNSTILAQNTQIGSHLNQFNIANPISNIQVQNFGNQNLFLNQGTNTIITPNIPNFSGNITINNGLIPNANITIPNNLVPNFLQTNIVQQQEIPNNIQRTGGFKLALSEDGRLILQHDPNLNQDIQSQLLLQSIFGINIPGNNLVLGSVNNQPVVPAPKPIAVVEPKKQEITTTKTTNIIQNSIPSVRTENQNEPPNQAPNNFSYIVNLTPEQLEILKRNGQLTVNGQTIFMHRPKGQENEKIKSPKSKTIKKKPIFEPKITKIENKIEKTQNSNIISALQSPLKLEEKEFAQNIACVQPNNSKIAPVKPELSPKKPKEDKKFEEKKEIFENGDVNVEQFLSNLNISPSSLGQLISQKLPGVDHKIVNITQGSTPGHIVAKIDISPENMQLLNSETPNTNIVPPLVSMKHENQENSFNGKFLFSYF